jgi:glycosyltransferase involved in cell wall biosynthesis
MRVPVVATDVGAVAEEVVDGRTGFLVPPGNAAALADGILRCLGKTRAELEPMLGAARERVESLFSLDQLAAGQKRIYEELLARRAR